MFCDKLSLSGLYCRSLLLLVAVGLILMAVVPAPAVAQRIKTPTETPPIGVPPGGGGIGGGAGLLPPPQLPAPAIAAPTLPSPPAPAVAPATPAAPARVVRFRCELAPEAETCREPGAPDGGGDDTECSCTRDHCSERYYPPLGRSLRICEKLQ